MFKRGRPDVSLIGNCRGAITMRSEWKIVHAGGNHCCRVF
jgi:hypothetical protein